MKATLFIVTLLALSAIAQGAWTNSHDITGDAKTQLQAAVKAKILANTDKIANTQTANALVADLNQADDAKRTLKEIDAATANQLFSIFGLKDPNCDTNGNGSLTGDELACLSKIWKNFVPQ